MWIVPMLALVFCLLGGRNDGSPLVAIRLKASRRVTAVPFLMLAAAVAVAKVYHRGPGRGCRPPTAASGRPSSPWFPPKGPADNVRSC